MKEPKVLLLHGSADNISFISVDRDDHMQALPLLPECLRVEREPDRHETRISLSSSEEQAEGQSQSLTAAARAFLAQYVSLGVLEVFSEWQGILIKFPTLAGAIWVVRDQQNGQRLSQETRQPFILLNELLAQEGHSTESGFSRKQITTKEKCHDKDAKDLVERSTRAATPHSSFGGGRKKA